MTDKGHVLNVKLLLLSLFSREYLYIVAECACLIVPKRYFSIDASNSDM